MDNEIERKFLVKNLPDLSGMQPLSYERYFLKRGDGTEERITRIIDIYKYEKKIELSRFERTKEEKEITQEEFGKLAKQSSEVIERDGYRISESPRISIKIYKGRFKGLIRAEVEFNTSEEAKNFRPPSWMGDEITDLPIARDSKLLDLSDEEFQRYIGL